MGLNKFQGVFSALRQSWFVTVVFGMFILGGCGSSEEATQQGTQEGEGQKLGATEQEKPKEEKGYDQALTSFVGKEPEKKEEPAKQPAAQPAQPATSYEKQIEDLRTENTSLKQKMVKLEQDNRSLNARITETESKLTAEKERADKAEEAAKNALMGSQPMSPVGKSIPEDFKKQPAVTTAAAPASMSAYEDALRAFNAKKYDDAMGAFQAILDGGVAEDLADNCKYWVGESNFAKKKYKNAMAAFEEVMKYKNSEKKGDAQFMIAQCYERTGNKVKAKEAYEKVVKDYPMSKNVKRSKERWAKL